MPRSSTDPFPDALVALLKSQDMTYRGLARATTQIDGRGLGHAYINMLANRHDKPSIRAMELIAAACHVKPTYFAEYRLAQGMRQLNPDEVGFEKALSNLKRLTGRR